MPGVYRTDLVSAAQRSLGRLSPDVQWRIVARIQALAAEPRPAGLRLLQGRDRYYRIRVGHYRIVYEIDDRERIVTIRIIGHRRDVYRGP